MHAQNIVLAALLVALSGCQKQEAAPAPTPAPPAMPAAAPAAPPAAQESMAATVKQAAPAADPAAAKPAPAPAKAPAAPAAMTGPAPAANDPLQLAKAKGCFACHTLDKKLVGPAWKDVAAKYRGDATAEAKLVDKVGKGGVGVWGAVPMPPNVLVSEADRKILVKFILSLK